MKKIWDYTAQEINKYCIDMYLGTNNDPTWKIVKVIDDKDLDSIKVINTFDNQGLWPLNEISLNSSLEVHRKLIEEKLDSIYNKPLEPFILKSRFSLIEDGNET